MSAHQTTVDYKLVAALSFDITCVCIIIAVLVEKTNAVNEIGMYTCFVTQAAIFVYLIVSEPTGRRAEAVPNAPRVYSASFAYHEWFRNASGMFGNNRVKQNGD